MSDQTNAPAHKDRGHSELGASSCYRWWNCPGSVRMQRGRPDTAGLAAQRGTAAHEVAQLCLETRQDAIEFTGRIVNGVEFDEDLVNCVQEYLDNCRRLVPHVILPSEMMIEVSFDLDSLGTPMAPVLDEFGEPTGELRPVHMFGTADFCAYVPISRELYIEDLKSGFVYVDASSPQLKYYALGAMLALGAGKPVSKIHASIVQPNGQRGDAVRSITYDADELIEWSFDLMAHAEAAAQPDAPLRAGSWCDYCKASGDCAEQARTALAAAQVEFVEDSIKVPELDTLSPRQKAEILIHKDLIMGWLNAVFDAALRDALADPDAVPGFKPVNKRAHRAFRDEAEAIEALTDVGLPSDALRTKPELLSPAQIETVLAEFEKAAGRYKTKKAAKEAAKLFLSDYVHSPSSGPTLAPVSDPRPALQAAGSEFDAMPDIT